MRARPGSPREGENRVGEGPRALPPLDLHPRSVVTAPGGDGAPPLRQRTYSVFRRS